MERKENIEFEMLLANEEFIRFVKEDRLRAKKLIDDLCRENPDREDAIRCAADLITYYHGQHASLDSETIRTMWGNILEKSGRKQQRPAFSLTPFLKVAASVAVVMLLTFYSYEYFRNNPIRKFAEKQVEISEEARIIISDGTAYKLKSNESHISYDADGKEIVVEEKDNQTERIYNQSEKSQEEYNQIVVPYGRRHNVTLGDGTVVQLNSGSTLIFPAKFSGAKREVYLKGEGFFEVTRNAERPFVVNTHSINIRVLGTKFNVSAYENEPTASAVLVDGSVEVFDNKLFGGANLRIKPNQGCFFDKTHPDLIVKEVDVNEYISWKDGILQFKDQPLSDIIEKVEKFYNCTITVEDEELANRIISGKLVLSSKFDDTIDLLARTTKSKYVIRDDNTCMLIK